MAQLRFSPLLRQETRLRSRRYLAGKPSIAWKRLVAGTLSGTLLYSPGLVFSAHAEPLPNVEVAQAQRVRPLVFAIAQHPDNAEEWDSITARLQAADLPHRVLDWLQVERTSHLAGIDILFLPNIKTISSGQLLALEAWMHQGGRLIVSGPIGQESSYGVQQALRSLLGAYWDQSLSQPATLETAEITSQSWIREGETDGSVRGGVIMPTGVSSQIVATWKDTPDSDRENKPSRSNDSAAAVVVTERSVFLGWEWGDRTGTTTFDNSWLRAAIGRYGDISLLAASQPTSSAQVAPAPQPPESLSSIPDASSRPLVPANRPATVTPLPLRPQPTTPTFTPPTRSVPSPANQMFDPAEQVAPAGVPVEMSALPITTLEAIAMRQELENLIGRYESALLAANSANSTTSLRPNALSEPSSSTQESVLTASADTAIASDSATGNKALGHSEIVQEARRILDEFPQLVSARDYASARQEWLRARQLLWDNFPTDRPLAQPEIRAIWLDRGTIVRAGSRRGLAQIFDRLADAGINTVFFETLNAGYPIYPSRVAPQQNPLTRHWDPLEAAVELAHERGIELHAWVWTFATGNRPHNTLVNLPADYPGPVLAAHPDWANYDNRGNMIPPGQGKPFLDPANPSVRRYLQQLFTEIVTRYDVDGLQLDYIRYPFQDPSAGRSYGYGLAARQQFQRIAGVDPIEISPSDRQLWQRWTDFRTEQVNSFVRDTSRILRQRRPDLVMSAAVFSFSEHERLQKIQQNWEVWARQGDIDLIVPMSYSMDTNRLQRLAGPWLNPEIDLGSALVLPGIRLLNLPEAATLDQIQALRDMPAGGYSLFAAENLNDSLHGIFSRTQGSEGDRARDPIPYRQPFAAAAVRYDALQREWSYLLNNGQLWMRDQQMEQWQTQSESLSEALQALAEQPSQQRLDRARRLLANYQNRFDSWMYLQSLNQSYRVRTWENRLATLNLLLNYGERIVERQGGSPSAAVETQERSF